MAIAFLCRRILPLGLVGGLLARASYAEILAGGAPALIEGAWAGHVLRRSEARRFVFGRDVRRRSVGRYEAVPGFCGPCASGWSDPSGEADLGAMRADSDAKPI